MYNIGFVQWITGKIELYKGKPEIVITNPDPIYDVVAATRQRKTNYFS